MSNGQRVIFAGTPVFAVPSLQALIDGPEEIVAVLTQPDRPAGRGRALAESPVKQLAQAHGLPVLQPDTLKNPEIQEQLRALAPDLMVVVAYGLLLPRPVLAIPRLGAINVHASLLPHFRGAAPIQRAIEDGEWETGVTIMQMETGLDSGPMLLKKRIHIDPEETGGSLHDKLKRLGAEALREALDGLWAGQLHAEPQDAALATYAPKLSKDEAQLDWLLPAADLERQVRAFNPYPVAETAFRGKTLRIWQAAVAPETGELGAPGSVLRVQPDGIWVATGGGALILKRVQLPGKDAMEIGAFVNGYQPKAGEMLGNAPQS
ncbi:methionyl-tRNA formyltransferase [Thermithiobacillus plumbiphilus]|uniref:Methionyl-tRNA formyltransferase n=1 Tax=Thermithiobacillus plumbiphilus TaxID=1729899 RepID=A0ABU9D7G9_9PROT